ncbi:MAG: ABC transporter permease [candidate division NC10 bacterium]|nr:ABC transporter permease [candidate division NC10 bacterium]MDE2321374.1 ABC transporter permease [candidate division NC10 bacterium]
MLFLPVILLLQVAFTLGLAWIVAAINVFLRDVGQLLGMILTLWLFLTPFFYPPSVIPQSLKWILLINPMGWVVEAYRSVILRGAFPAAWVYDSPGDLLSRCLQRGLQAVPEDAGRLCRRDLTNAVEAPRTVEDVLR